MVDERTVTLILPTYNRPTLLSRAIRSVLSSTYENFVLNIYDNASAPQTCDVVNDFIAKDRRVKYYRHDENIGALRNFAFGLSRVETPFFAMISDDDVPLPNFLDVPMQGFASQIEAGFSAGATLEVSDRGGLIFAPLSGWDRYGAFSGADGLQRLLDGNHPSWNTIVFRSAAIESVGPFDPTLGLVFDLEFTLRVAARFPFVVSSEPTGIFVRHGLSSTEFADARVSADYDAVIERVTKWDIERDTRDAVIRGLCRAKIARLQEVSVKLMLVGKMAKSRDALNEAVSSGAVDIKQRMLLLLCELMPRFWPLKFLLGGAVRFWQLRRRVRCERLMRARNVPYDPALVRKLVLAKK